ELFPGILDDLIADGAPVIADGDLSEMHFVLGGHRLASSGRFRDRRATYVPSRPLLEHHVRRRVRAIPNITLLDGHNVGDLATTPDRCRVTGVQVGSREGVRTITAELVVDAMGRGARTPAGLEKLGYGRPAEEHVVVHVVYRSQLLRLAPGTPMEKMVLIGAVPGRPAGMALRSEEHTSELQSRENLVCRRLL